MPKDNIEILLIKVPEIDFIKEKTDYSEELSLKTPPIPLGLGSISAYLKQKTDHNIHIFDVFLEGFDVYKKNQSRDVFT